MQVKKGVGSNLGSIFRPANFTGSKFDPKLRLDYWRHYPIIGATDNYLTSSTSPEGQVVRLLSVAPKPSNNGAMVNVAPIIMFRATASSIVFLHSDLPVPAFGTGSKYSQNSFKCPGCIHLTEMPRGMMNASPALKVSFLPLLSSRVTEPSKT